MSKKILRKDSVTAITQDEQNSTIFYTIFTSVYFKLTTGNHIETAVIYIQIHIETADNVSVFGVL